MTLEPRADRVLAVMAKAPRRGHVKTRLATEYGPDAIVALYRRLVEDTIDLARSLRLATVAVCPPGDQDDVRAWLPADVAVLPQQGADLAAALASVFEMLCTAERRPVVAFNGDGPHLPPAVLESAFDALAKHDLVVGPCDDGGYYLVGCTRPPGRVFDREAMGTRTALDALLARARSLGLTTTLTASHYDVDLPGDVVRLAADLARDPARAPRTAALLTTWQRGSRHAQA